MRRLFAGALACAVTAALLGCGSGGKDTPPAKLESAPKELPGAGGAKEKGTKGTETKGAESAQQ